MTTIQDPCPVCGTRGWLLARNDVHGLRIERCDECQIMNDEQAWNDAEPFLVNLLMRFDEGTNLDKLIVSVPSSQHNQTEVEA